ncbi:MAG TPA: hypothetical protein VMV65_04080 [Alphaproteobacteria bacterium]|nr:hypothetical protein [Alphaproteobacteria bacterium]
MAAAITAREFKLLLKPELFPTKKAVLEFNNRLTKLSADAGVRYEPFDRIDSEMRGVQFFDTPDCVFRQNRIILRLRRDASSGFPDETYEVTFKRRSPDFRESADFDIDSTMKEISVKKKFKEEILRGEGQGTIKSIFSNNLIGYYPVAKFEHPLSEIVEIFPGLKALNLDASKTVSAVNNARVIEVGARLGIYNFGKNTSAHADLAVWARPSTDSFDVLVAEFGWSYHMQGDVSKQQKAHEAADQFFKDLQKPLWDDLFAGSTKTALIYGGDEV